MIKTKQKLFLKFIFLLTAVFLGIIQAWNNRYTLSTGDAISYLDIADAYFARDWNNAINGYFSPLYSWILGIFIHLLQPSTYWEFFVVKITNFFIFILSLICFELLLREFIFYYYKRIKKINNHLPLPEWFWWISGYTLFLWASLKWIGVNTDTPDMLVSAIVYLATAIILRIYTKSDKWFNFVGLGIVLGLGYLAKAIMFPMAFIFMGISLFSINLRKSIPKVILTFFIFALIATPFILAISATKGHLTFGNAGKLNYAWLVSPGGISNHNWQGEPPGSGIPKHPTRKIFTDPTVYEFATPIAGTYPPWHDPSYWNEGLKSTPNLSKQIERITKHLGVYYSVFIGGFLFYYSILVIFSGKLWLSVREIIGNWRLLIPAGAGLCSLMLIHVRPRLIASFCVLLAMGIFGSLRLPDSDQSKRFLIGLILGSLCLFSTQFSDLSVNAGEHINWKIAHNLNNLGLNPEDKIAILGSYRVGKSYYWARLARFKIVAEIPNINEFWSASEQNRNEIYQAIVKTTGAKAIIQKPQAHSPLDYINVPGWKKIKNSNVYIYFLPTIETLKFDLDLKNK